MKSNTNTASVNLFCLPFAGGHRYSYRDYSEKAPAFLNVIALEYPGRVARMKEPLLTDISSLVDDLFKQISPRTSERPYAIYGHSMGGLIAYLLTRKLIAEGFKAPLHLFITGTSGPSAESRFVKMRHLLPRQEFLQEMRELDGIPEAILQNDELLEYFEPILRSDFQACETYRHVEAPPLNIPITVITGDQEDMTLEDIGLWQNESTQKVDFIRMPGKHFFIFDYPTEVVEIITKKLTFSI